MDAKESISGLNSKTLLHYDHLVIFCYITVRVVIYIHKNNDYSMNDDVAE